MQPVAVRILHPASSPTTGELARALAAVRATNAERLAVLFRRAGATDVRIETGGEMASFGDRLRALVAEILGETGDGQAGLVLLGSGAVPLATPRFAGRLMAVAGSGEQLALANNAYSADVLAVGRAATLAAVPDLPTDNALPRWLRDEAGYRVEDVRSQWRLAIDLDSPLDALLVGRWSGTHEGAPVAERFGRIAAVAADPRAELVVAGRSSADTLRWLERRTASRTRALIEERGLRAIGLATTRRPPRSALGLVLDDRGPEALGAVLAELGDAAIVDSRVLLAHRLGASEAGWPPPEDRYASDLLLADRVGDPWLRALTVAARDSSIPVLLGGHTLVGPGVRLILGRYR